MARVSTGRDLIPLLFGATERDELSGRLLVGLLGDLGIGRSSARTLISRTVQWGGLESTRTGRETTYRIGAGIRDSFESLRRREGPAPTWGGSFHGVLYSVPEPERAYRDLMRNRALQAGYGTLRAGLMIHPEDRWEEVVAHLPPLPAGSALRTGEIRFDLATAREVAVETWDVAGLAEAYRAQRRRLRSVAARHVEATPPERAVRRYVDAVRPAFAILYADPNLPAVLLPADWPRDATTSVLQEVIDGFGAAVQLRLAGLSAS